MENNIKNAEVGMDFFLMARQKYFSTRQPREVDFGQLP